MSNNNSNWDDLANCMSNFRSGAKKPQGGGAPVSETLYRLAEGELKRKIARLEKEGASAIVLVTLKGDLALVQNRTASRALVKKYINV